MVAFLDILGLRALVERMFGKRDVSLYSAVRHALEKASLQLASCAPFGIRRAAPTFEATALSDSIVLSDRPDGHGALTVLSEAAFLAAALLRDGILCRGGVAIGKNVPQREHRARGRTASYRGRRRPASFRRRGRATLTDLRFSGCGD
ncbi:MAG: hypothetical protein AB1689_08670 [Thermodesulfobacteriota bacterium]